MNTLAENCGWWWVGGGHQLMPPSHAEVGRDDRLPHAKKWKSVSACGKVVKYHFIGNIFAKNGKKLSEHGLGKSQKWKLVSRPTSVSVLSASWSNIAVIKRLGVETWCEQVAKSSRNDVMFNNT